MCHPAPIHQLLAILLLSRRRQKSAYSTTTEQTPSRTWIWSIYTRLRLLDGSHSTNATNRQTCLLVLQSTAAPITESARIACKSRRLHTIASQNRNRTSQRVMPNAMVACQAFAHVRNCQHHLSSSGARNRSQPGFEHMQADVYTSCRNPGRAQSHRIVTGQRI